MKKFVLCIVLASGCEGGVSPPLESEGETSSDGGTVYYVDTDAGPPNMVFIDAGPGATTSTPYTKVDVMFLLDNSGSMCPTIEKLGAAAHRALTDLAGSEHHFGLAIVPGNLEATMPWRVMVQPTDALLFLTILDTVTCDGGAEEPSYDTLYDAAAPTGGMVQWRSDAFPYVVFIGDEVPQWTSPRDLTESQVAAVMTDCQVGACLPGDKVEVFLIIDADFTADYGEIVYNETDRRIFNINPVEEDRFVEMFSDILADAAP